MLEKRVKGEDIETSRETQTITVKQGNKQRGFFFSNQNDLIKIVTIYREKSRVSSCSVSKQDVPPHAHPVILEVVREKPSHVINLLVSVIIGTIGSIHDNGAFVCRYQ